MRHRIHLDPAELAAWQGDVLSPSTPLTAPVLGAGVGVTAPVRGWREAASGLAAGLEAEGLGLVSLVEPLPVDDYVALGRTLGEPLPENDPAVAPYVEAGVVLSLQDRLRSDDDSLTPFTPRALTLHTEGSRRPARQQPRYIVLMCLDPGAAGDASQTVLVPVRAVVDQLDEQDLAVLCDTREDVVAGSAPFARREDGAVRLSFRDLGAEPYDLESPHDEDAVARAVRHLVRALYLARPVFGTHWRRGDVVAIDNRRWLHGRTGARPAGGPARHLVRLRIVAS